MTWDGGKRELGSVQALQKDNLTKGKHILLIANMVYYLCKDSAETKGQHGWFGDGGHILKAIGLGFRRNISEGN